MCDDTSSDKRWSRVSSNERKRRRRREFRDQLREASWTKQVLQDNREGVCRAYTDSEESETYTIYMHYSDNFDWWGIAEQKQRELSARSAQLMHAFLGRQRDEWYIVPDKDVNNLNLGKQIRKTDHYKVEINHGNPSNQTLLKHYSIYEGAQS